MKLEHIGIAVNDLSESEKIFEELFLSPVYKREEIPGQAVITSFIQLPNVKIELLQTTDEEGPIGRFLNKKGPGIHHIAFEVEDILKEMNRLQEAGYTLLSDHPLPGADHKYVVFLHPKSTEKVLIELCQTIPPTEESRE